MTRPWPQRCHRRTTDVRYVGCWEGHGDEMRRVGTIVMVRAVEVNTAALWVQPCIAAVPEADPLVSGDAQVTVAEEAVRPRWGVRGVALGDRATPPTESLRSRGAQQGRGGVYTCRQGKAGQRTP
jgi:hypothetical protein